MKAVRPPKTVTWVALLVLLFQTTACHSFRSFEGELPTAWSPGMEEQVVWVELKSGEKWELIEASKDSLAVRGKAKRLRVDGERPSVNFPLADVGSLLEEHLSPGKTAVLCGLVAGVLVAIVGALGNLTLDLGPAFAGPS